jgi:hypothetical protein
MKNNLKFKTGAASHKARNAQKYRSDYLEPQ